MSLDFPARVALRVPCRHVFCRKPARSRKGRRAASAATQVDDAFVAFQADGKGILAARVEGPDRSPALVRTGVGAARNLLFAFPLSVNVTAQRTTRAAVPQRA